MSLSQRQLNTAQRASEDIDWISVIRIFSVHHDMQFMETLKWIANRTSLQVACEVLGVALSPSIAARYTDSDLHILNSLGDILWTYGFEVPRLMEHRRMEYRRKGREFMGFSLSREEYLMERAKGKSKNQIAHQEGISGPALFHWLNKWGLKDSSVEQREIEQLLKSEGGNGNRMSDPNESALLQTTSSTASAAVDGTAPVSQVNTVTANDSKDDTREGDFIVYRSSQQLHLRSQSTVSSNHRDTHHLEADETGIAKVQLSLAVEATEPSSLISNDQQPIDLANLARDEVMQTGLQMIRYAVTQAYSDLVGLLGEEAAKEQIQQYVDRQIRNFAKPTD